MPILSNIIDSFSNSTGSYVLRYNETTVAIDVDYTGSNEAVLLSSADRGGYSEGDFVNTITTSTGDAISFFATLAFPFLTFTPPGDGGGDDGGGGGPGCDLTIGSIAVTNQSATGANDGAISISASSSNGPIQYSIDNVSWTSSNTFTALPAGSGTVYVKDNLACTANQAYTVATNTVVTEPNRLVSTPAVGASRWSALFNPVVFAYQSPEQVPGRKFITEITSGYDGATNVITATHYANLTGYCRADISKYLRTLLQPKDDFDYSTLNYRDANISASYTVRYMEVWDGGQTDWISAGDPFYITYSAMQIGNKTGGNMSPYVTYPTPGQANPAKFLNDFKTPVLYTDLPFDLSFIYSEKIAGYQIKLGGNGIDINANICGALGELMLLNEDGSVLLNEDGSKLLIEQQAPGVLLSQLGVNRLQITQNIPTNSIWLDVFLFYTDTYGNNIQVTENRRLLLDNSPCNALPYEYLKWMGPSGGWLYYLLSVNQIHEISTTDAVLTELYIDDYATADSTQQLISMSAQKKITAGKNDIHAHEAEALATILYSPKVYRLVDAATNTWQGVIMDTKSLTLYQTTAQTGDFEIAYLLPEVNVQRA